MYTHFGNANIISETTELAMDGNNQNQWSHLTIVKDGNVLSMYINGVLDSSGEISQSTKDLGTLNSNTIGESMTLVIDEFKLYNRALSP